MQQRQRIITYLLLLMMGCRIVLKKWNLYSLVKNVRRTNYRVSISKHQPCAWLDFIT